MTSEEQAAADAAAALSAKEAEVSKAKDPTYLESELKKAIEARDKAKARAKELEASEKELQAIKDKDLSESQRLAKENAALAGKASRAEALEAQVQGILDDATKDLTDAQKAAIVGDTPEAKLAHLRALQAAGMLGEKKGVEGFGTRMPSGSPAGQTMQRAAFDRLAPRNQSEFVMKGGRVVE